MLRANQESPSKLLLTVAGCVLTLTICVQAASAETIFFDNFNDGNAGDGMPVTWSPGPGTWDASSGDYVATGSSPRVSRVPDHVLGDTSARTQVRVTGTIGAALAVRRPSPIVGYAGEIRANGTMGIARLDGAPTPVILGTAAVPFNPVDQDILLQFDAFGDKLSLWAWPVGESMPDEPQVVAFDATYPEGPAGLISAAFVSSPTDSTTFRFVHVANTHIPEPSTLVLMSLGICGLLYARRRKPA
jgi:hypothetical protein